MIKSIIWTVVFAFVAAILQSTLLSRIALNGAVADLALGVIVYSSYVNGVMIGQLSGFFYGLLLRFISAAPLGLHAFILTITGALTGLFKGIFFLDVFLLPMILCASATLFKAFFFFILNLLVPETAPSYSFFTPVLWVELALNSFSAPLLFAFLKRFTPMKARPLPERG